MKKYHYFYKITNNINNHYYFGVHSTNDLDDGYMGSGIRLKLAYQKYGIENFTKEILKFFDTAEKAFLYEAEVVNENLILSDDCYNVQQGGRTFNAANMLVVQDNKGNAFLVHKTDPRYISGELKFMWKDKHHTEESKNKTRKAMTPKNSTNSRIWVNKNGIVKYLDKKYLEEYLNSGWSLGRKNYKPRKGKQGVKIN